MAQLRAIGPAVATRFPIVGRVWVTTTYEATARVLKDGTLFTLRKEDGAPVGLTRTERRLLRELAVHAGDVVTREELLERVWGYRDIGDSRLLDVHVRRLRLKVEVDASAPERIVTVRGLGYRFER